MIRSDKLRDSARGQICTLQLPGICNHDPATTVLAHLPDESHGLARKSDDISACHSCSACHDWLDRRAHADRFVAEDREWFMRRAQTRTLRRCIEMGLVTLA